MRYKVRCAMFGCSCAVNVIYAGADGESDLEAF